MTDTDTAGRLMPTRTKRKHTAEERAESRWLIAHDDINGNRPRIAYWRAPNEGQSYDRTEAYRYTHAEAVDTISVFGAPGRNPRPIYLRPRTPAPTKPADRWGVWLTAENCWGAYDLSSRAEAQAQCDDPLLYADTERHGKRGAVPRLIGPDGKPVEEPQVDPQWAANRPSLAAEAMSAALLASGEAADATKAVTALRDALSATVEAQGQHRIELTEQGRRIEALEQAQRTRDASHASAMASSVAAERAALKRANAAESVLCTARVERDIYRRRAEEAEARIKRAVAVLDRAGHGTEVRLALTLP